MRKKSLRKKLGWGRNQILMRERCWAAHNFAATFSQEKTEIPAASADLHQPLKTAILSTLSTVLLSEDERLVQPTPTGIFFHFKGTVSRDGPGSCSCDGWGLSANFQEDPLKKKKLNFLGVTAKNGCYPTGCYDIQSIQLFLWIC